ncbi:hypothetical protein KC333_g422 [Hortaea werneckii]|nr:hypothetical protein KC333_g422 [Hortaea werneckii]KAI7324504.1 hypothetical protein KC326_g1033 [Hortaea werneckii]
MPNLKLFNRRKSSGSALDIQPEGATPAQSSFRVIERTERPVHSFDGKPPTRPYSAALAGLRGKSVENLVGLSANRGSGGTTNSSTSGYYDSSAASARHSSSSTLPSSVDPERDPDDEELFPRKPKTTSMLQSLSTDADTPLPPPPSFRSRAVRAISFGQKSNRTSPAPYNGPADESTPSFEAPQIPEHRASPQRDRSTTESSYASTAVPTKPQQNLSLGAPDFGEDDDFGNMFAGIGKTKSREELPLQRPPVVGGFHRTESEPMFPPKTHSRASFTPSPSAIGTSRDGADSPYGWDTRNSQDGLMSGSALSSPRLDDRPSPGIAPAFLGRAKGYEPLPNRNTSPELERTSSSDERESFIGNKAGGETSYSNRQSHLDDGDRWIRRVQLSDGPTLSHPASTNSFNTSLPKREPSPSRVPQAVAGANREGAASPYSEKDEPLFGTESLNATPRAVKAAQSKFQDATLFDSSPSGPPSRAIRPSHDRTASGTPKRMTKAQFDALQRGDSSQEHSAEEDAHAEDEYDDEDDSERTEQAIKQRRKQEANMAVYRQQMKKVTGGGPSALPNARPSLDRNSQSAPPGSTNGLHMGGIGGNPPTESIRGKPEADEDDDVPLGILQAHGFPNAGRPPTRTGENDAQRRASGAASIVGGGAGQGHLPPFARRLPQDPYFGASLVNPSNRESMAFSSNQSMYGGAPQQQSPGHPGGLVGVIAGEERAKAARRANPSMLSNSFSPLPSNMPQMAPQMPQMPRTMSMGSVAAPSVYSPSGYMPGMPPTPQMPQMPMPPGPDASQMQMHQFMQMQMQVMQNMLAMQQQQMGQSSPQPQSQDYLGVPGAGSRPMSIANQSPGFPGGMPNQGRAMTMMAPPPQWDANQGQRRPSSAMPGAFGHDQNNLGGPGPGYTPSIAPSERSNIGLPNRYRPVQTNGDAGTPRSHSMTSSMTLQAFTNHQRPESRQEQQRNTIRVVDKPKGSAKISARQIGPEEDEDDGWAEMAKKRSEKKFGWRRKDKKASQNEPALSDMYHNFE